MTRARRSPTAQVAIWSSPNRGRRHFAGDGAKKDEDGDIRLLGRVDDVMTGQGLVAFVILRGDAASARSASAEEVVAELRTHVAREIGPIARPRQIMVVAELPRTRSGTIMRRLLRDVAENRDLGDVTALTDPRAVLREARRHSRTAPAAHTLGGPGGSTARRRASPARPSREVEGCSDLRRWRVNVGSLGFVERIGRPEPGRAAVTS
jgi:hypothetical protein